MEIDTDQTGLISSEEIKKYIEKLDHDVTDAEIAKLMKELDYSGNG